MTRNIVFRPIAQRDFDSAIIYIALILKSPKAARDSRNGIIDGIKRAAELPEMGRLHSERRLEIEPIRSLLIKNYRVFYTYDNDELVVLRIFHTMQDIDEFSLENL